MNNLKNMTNIINNIADAVVITDKNKDVVFYNFHFKQLFGEISNIEKIEHRFNFDIGILDAENLLKYNPISAALSHDEAFSTHASFQVTENTFKNILIKSFNENEYKVLIFEEIKIDNTTENNNSGMLENPELLAIRASLLNRISYSIRDMWDINEIIRATLNETIVALGLKGGFYCDDEANYVFEQGVESFNKDNIPVNPSRIDVSMSLANNNELYPRLIIPITYRDKFLGAIGLYHNSNLRNWLPDEISLVENIASLLGTAVNQANLFSELELQKQRVELALNELKQAQAQLIQSEKMASIGQLVAGVAHEINTPLGAINSNSDILNRYILKFKDSDKPFPYDSILNINSVTADAIDRINKIVKSLKTFSRLDEAEVQRVNIHQGIDSTLLLINHEIKNRIEIQKEYGDIPDIVCYPDLLNQVFMNLLVNSYQSIKDSGTIKIKTEICDNNIRVMFIDTGIGISKENQAKIFDPGFTTKGVGVGTGLGLAITYQIIEKHKGRIEVESELDKGTKITVILPMVDV